MHMDVKEPAKLGVRFNWCKCVAGRLAASAGSPVLAGLSSAVVQASRESRACTKQAPLPCHLSHAKLAKQEAKLPW